MTSYVQVRSTIQRCYSCQNALGFYFQDRSRIVSGDFDLQYNFSSLEKSAAGGCDLCRILWQALVYEEPPGVDLRKSTELVRLSSDSITLTIQLQCKVNNGRGIIVSNVLWSMRPELKTMGGKECDLWNPTARIIFRSHLVYDKLILVQGIMDHNHWKTLTTSIPRFFSGSENADALQSFQTAAHKAFQLALLMSDL
jgi:hypothetical protein